jgi:RNA polymerase sigma-70 factor (ECF subfamily)
LIFSGKRNNIVIYFSFVRLFYIREAAAINFDELYEKHKCPMLRAAYGILHDHMLAEDAVAEAFIRLYKHIGGMDENSPAKTAAFINVVVRNCALTIYRKKQRFILLEPEAEALQPDDSDIEESVASKLADDEIYTVISSLKEELRAPFLLQFAYDLSLRDISKLLGISENNTAVRISRARAKLKVLLKGGKAYEKTR